MCSYTEDKDVGERESLKRWERKNVLVRSYSARVSNPNETGLSKKELIG